MWMISVLCGAEEAKMKPNHLIGSKVGRKCDYAMDIPGGRMANVVYTLKESST
jgi:hypothetical protein